MDSHFTSHPHDFNERLQSYLDGELNANEQAELFSQLGDDANLQAELRSMIKLESALRSTNDVVAPPALKSSIMSAISSIPLTGGAVAQTGTTLSTATTVATSSSAVVNGSGVTSKSAIASIPFLAGLGGALLGGLISWYALANGSNTNAADAMSKDSITIHRQQFASESLQLANLQRQLSNREQLIEQLTASLSSNATANNDLLQQLRRLQNEVRILRSTIIDDSNQRNQAWMAKADDNNKQVTDALTTNNESTSERYLRSLAESQPVPLASERRIVEERNHVVPLLTSTQGTTIITATNGVQLDLRGYSMRSYPTVNVSSLVSPPLNNLALGIRWSLAKEHSIGVEVGQENVLQKYTSEQNGISLEIEQNYLALWGGFSYQYSPQAIFGQNDVTPFVRGVVGASRLGPIARSVLGVNLNITPTLRITGGAEGAMFFYQEKNAWFSTSKLGWTVGVGIGL